VLRRSRRLGERERWFRDILPGGRVGAWLTQVQDCIPYVLWPVTVFPLALATLVVFTAIFIVIPPRFRK
jgi:hypothetical protein